MDVDVELSEIEWMLIEKYAAEKGLTMEEFFMEALREYVYKNTKN